MSRRSWTSQPLLRLFDHLPDLFQKRPAKKSDCRPSLETLEDRLAPATLVHLYELNGTLTDSISGPTLLADGGSFFQSSRYLFGPNQGLRLINGLPDITNYSIVMKAAVNNGPFFKKVIDF